MIRVTVTCDAVADAELYGTACGAERDVELPLDTPGDRIGTRAAALLAELDRNGWQLVTVTAPDLSLGHAYVCGDCATRVRAGGAIALRIPQAVAS